MPSWRGPPGPEESRVQRRGTLAKDSGSHLAVAEAADQVIINQTHGLHERIANRGTRKIEATPLQVLAHCVGLGGPSGNLFQAPPRVHARLSADELPDIVVESAELLLHSKKSLGVPGRGLNLETIPNDAGIVQKFSNFSAVISRYHRRVELRKGGPKVFPLCQDRLPAQARLRSFQDEKLKKHLIIMLRHAPFPIVIGNGQWTSCPRTTH